MISWDCCRMCLCKITLNPISSDNEEKDYLEMVYKVTGVKILLNDQLPKQICKECTECIDNFLKYREKCQETQKILNSELKSRTISFKIENQCNNNSVDTKYQKRDSQERKTELSNDSFRTNPENFDGPLSFTDDSNSIQNHDLNFVDITDITKTINNIRPKLVESKKIKVKLKPKKKLIKTPSGNKLNKINKNSNTQVNCETEMDKQTIEEVKCEYCDKVLTTKTSLRNHYKIHTGFDIVCEHCGKKFITKRLLLMHCKAKHGYEKTDKCSFCDYKGCNSEQVKIHERKHTGERPYVCKECNASFFRKSSYLQHVATHLPEKTVQCKQCPARFKSVTLMKIHANKHRMTQFSYICYVCHSSFARRRNVLRHLRRIHSVTDLTQHIERVSK